MLPTVQYLTARMYLRSALKALTEAPLSDDEVVDLLETSCLVVEELTRPDKDSTHH